MQDEQTPTRIKSKELQPKVVRRREKTLLQSQAQQKSQTRR